MAEIIQMDSSTWSFEDDFVRFFLVEGDLHSRSYKRKPCFFGFEQESTLCR